MRLPLRSWWRRSGGPRSTASKPARPWRPVFECLEDRTVPSVTVPTAGSPGPVTLTGTAGPDQFVIRLQSGNTGNIQFSDNGGSTFTSAALSDVTSITVNGLTGNDTLTIDNSNGLVAAGGTGGLAITFDGGAGVDTLVVSGNPGGAAVRETFTPGSSSTAGTLQLGNGTASATVTLTSVSGIVDTLTADTLTINANDNNNLIAIRSGPTINGQRTLTVQAVNAGALDDEGNHHRGDQGDDDQEDDRDDDEMDEVSKGSNAANDNAGTMFITFANKTNGVINTLGGNDLIVINAPTAPTGLQTLTIDGGTGLNVLAARALPPGVGVTLNNITRTDDDPDDIFIDELYESRLGRSDDASEVAFWKRNLHGPLGRLAVVRGIEESQEGRTHLVQNWYRRFLGRDAAGGEEQGWVRLLLRGLSEEQILSGILASREFFNRAQQLFNTGNANENLIRALYQLVLNRDADDGGLNTWMNALPRMGAAQVALAFLQSREFRENTIDGFYGTLLHRNGEDRGLNDWVDSRLDLLHVREGFEAAEEFFENG